MKKIISRSGLALVTVAVVIAGAAAFSAYEAHIVNVTATIENATQISTEALAYGTVFPQEILHQPVTLSLSSSFVAADGTTGVDYVIKQKPKCQLNPQPGTGGQLPPYAPVTEDANGIFSCPPDYSMMPLLCPFLSKTSPTNGDVSVPSFHGPLTDWNDATSEQYAAVGYLTRNNPSTTWDIDLHVPCFNGECAQDWASYVHTANASADPNAYMLDPGLKGDALGCDLWYELTSVNRAPAVKVGADFAAYVAPTQPQCSDTVSGGESIQTSINEMGPDSVICVDPSYTGLGDQHPIVINENNDTLAGLGAAGSASLPGGVRIDNDGVTVKGLTIHNSNFTGEIAAVYLSAGVDNATVKFNDLSGPGKTTANSEGLINVTGFTTTGLTFDNNKSHDWLRGIFLNDSTNMTLTYNTLTGNGVGSANDHPHGNVLTNNLIKNNTLEGVGVLNGVGDTFSANFNSIYDNNTPNSNNDLHNYGAVSVSAENNWWGDISPADSVAGSVSYTPFASSAYTEN